MKRAIFPMLCAALLATSATALAAPVPAPSAFTLKAGASVQSNAGTPLGLALGADYIFHPASALQPFDGSVYAEVLGKSEGAGLAIRNGGPLYAGIGAGFYHASIAPGTGCGAGSLPGCPQPTYTSSGFGFKLFGGFKVAPFTSLEFDYHNLPPAGGFDTDTYALQLAVRL